jgi:hypothetical protein
MLVGDPMNRAPKYKMQSCFRCYSGPNFGGDDLAPCSDSKVDTEGFPPKPCLGGIRSNILYPTSVFSCGILNLDIRAHEFIDAGMARTSIVPTIKTM